MNLPQRLFWASLAILLASSFAAHAATAPSAGGARRSCSIDSDGDGLPDCVETGTGRYAGPGDTGTDPLNADSDGDGISDGDEVNGTAGALNLAAFGVSPVHKDILLEYDWIDDASGCGGAHSHRPDDAMLAVVAEAFASAPVMNPDGTSGIHVFQDLAPPTGAQSADSGSNRIDDADGFIDGTIGGDDYAAKEAANFDARRAGYFHYVIFAHGYTGAPGSSGQATIGGHHMLVTLGCGYANVNEVAYTIMHELGHNLGLRHGGDEDCNDKPNYDSVMNYRYQFTGAVDCTQHPLGRPDYSRGTHAPLNENALVERNGICPIHGAIGRVTPIDWNSNHVIDAAPIAYDVNFDPHTTCPGLTVLHDYDDWAHLALDGVRTMAAPVSEACAPPPALQ
ncbi:MAG TPA: hypothetical protein VKB52_14065 [Rhodanobacteraceae bacterium]|nr:hypothetical protein [Rhodanobacteraceae bacterium]